ncbi:hypothetical protein ALO92_101346 [Pseudomonas congelans]|uniref:Uncharacterized protein n=1 Tax=Pseudomonas congelans TaxID=200452 RepID=A0A0P9MHR3_9PSED|nr:hypothetical protein ALO92_101346 [Pseudomonas congelans]
MHLVFLKTGPDCSGAIDNPFAINCHCRQVLGHTWKAWHR